MLTRPSKPLVPASSGHLVQAAGRQLAIAIRLQDEIERERFKAFLRHNPLVLKIRHWHSNYFPLDEALLERFGGWWDWKRLSCNEAMPWSEALIERYADRWNWTGILGKGLSGNAALPWSEALIERFAGCWDWDKLSCNEALPWSEALIERFANRWDWENLSCNKALPWSVDLLEAFESRWRWTGTCIGIDSMWKLLRRADVIELLEELP